MGKQGEGVVSKIGERKNNGSPSGGEPCIFKGLPDSGLRRLPFGLVLPAFGLRSAGYHHNQ